MTSRPLVMISSWSSKIFTKRPRGECRYAVARRGCGVVPVVDTAKCLDGLAGLAGVSLTRGVAFDWAAIEADLGTRLPADYKLLAEAFPGGWFRQFVRPGSRLAWLGGAAAAR